jgi:hypothetical protein
VAKTVAQIAKGFFPRSFAEPAGRFIIALWIDVQDSGIFLAVQSFLPLLLDCVAELCVGQQVITHGN